MVNVEQAVKAYPVWRNLKIALKEVRYAGYKYYVYFVANMITEIFVPFLLILIPAEMIRLLEMGIKGEDILWSLAGWMLIVFVLNFVRVYTMEKTKQVASMIMEAVYWANLNKMILLLPLDTMENNEEREELIGIMRTLNVTDGLGQFAGLPGLYLYSMSFIINIAGFILYATMTGSLHIVLLIILITTSIINCYGSMRAIKYEFSHIGRFWENNGKYWYLKKEAINVAKAKDIRMYGIRHWFKSSLLTNTKEATSIYDDIKKRYLYADVTVNVTALFRDAFVYGFLIWQLMQGNMQISLFILYVGLASGFSTWIQKIVESYTYVKKISNGFSIYHFYFDQLHEQRVTHDINWRKCKDIQFDNVCFGYDAHMVFSNFNLHIKEGEKLALVGINGAGKTTLVKLLCGLYETQNGHIYMNGEDIANIYPKSYRKQFSILFQDIHILPFSIAENVACVNAVSLESQNARIQEIYDAIGNDGEELLNYDEERVIACIKKAGLWDKIVSLPKGIHTSLSQVLDPEGIQLSGGETQRLMLARALYKDAPVLILDEPTSALDPIAESELYESYASLCAGKTSIFISHRLSSTKFCDRIIFLEHGKIVEEGTHDALMEKNGKYAEMYHIQAHYYQREALKHEAGL